MNEIINRIHELLRHDIKRDKIKQYYIGTPANLSVDLMPCIITTFQTGEIGVTITGHDTDVIVLNITFISPKKGYIDLNHNKGEVSGYKQFLETFNGLVFNGTTITRKSDSIIQVLRKHYTLLGDTRNADASIVFSNNITWSLDEPNDDKVFYQANIRLELKCFVQQIIRQ